MSTAFVLSGGGSLGAVQVGMLQALEARGIRPDLLLGTSAGAVNAAWVAGHGMSQPSLAELGRLWGGLRRSDVFPVQPARVLRALLGHRPSLCSSNGLRDLVTRCVGIHDFAEATVPLHLVGTDLLSGEEVLLGTGAVAPAVLASTAVPGVFPPVHVDGRYVVDGGVAHHTAVSTAVDLGATAIYVLPAGYPCALAAPPESALGVALHALTLLIEQRLIAEVAGYSGAATIRVLPPLCPLAVSAADSTRAHELVERARGASEQWLEAGGTDLPEQDRFLSLHRHAPAHTPGARRRAGVRRDAVP